MLTGFVLVLVFWPAWLVFWCWCMANPQGRDAPVRWGVVASFVGTIALIFGYAFMQ